MVLVIDGSWGEGGGQILRTALSLALLVNEPVEIINIRAKRPKPGLRPQHLTALRLLAKIGNAKIQGDYVGSMKVRFEPGRIRGGEFSVNIGTAGSLTLLIQAIAPASLFTNLSVKMIGGTDVPFSPPADYTKNVFLRAIKQMGARVSMNIVRRGYYPVGGGIIVYRTQETEQLREIRIVKFESEDLVRGVSHAGNLPEHVVLRQKKAAIRALEEAGLVAEIETELRKGIPSTGCGITLWTEKNFIGASELGRKGYPAEEVGKTAANKLISEFKAEAPVDSHLTDQLIPFMALADGISEIKFTELSQHAGTNIWVVEQMLGVKFSVDEDEKRIRVKGIGYSPTY